VSYTQKAKASAVAPTTFAAAADKLRGPELTKPLAEQYGKSAEFRQAESVHLTGGISWAVATLMYPEKLRDAEVTITPEDIEAFRKKLADAKGAFPAADYSRMPAADKALRTDAEAEVQRVARVFTAENLTAGTEILKATAEAMEWKSKKVR